MEFTLEQLTPGNLKLIFEAAAYTVVDCSDHEMEGDTIEKHGGLTIKDNDLYWVISPHNNFDHIRFSSSFFIKGSGEENTPEVVFLKVSNIFDKMPVHARYLGTDEEGDHAFNFCNSAIFPEGGTVEGARIIKIFRVFQQMVMANRSLFGEVFESVKASS